MSRSEGDVRATKLVRSELGKRGIDTLRADIRVMHGVCYIRGAVGRERNATFSDIRSEMELVAKVLKSKSEIKDVVIDCNYRT